MLVIAEARVSSEHFDDFGYSDGLLNQDLNMCSAEASIRNAAAIPGYVLR